MLNSYTNGCTPVLHNVVNHSSTIVFCSTSFSLPLSHRHLIPMHSMERSTMQSIISHTAYSSISLIPWTTHDMKKSMIKFSVVLTNGLLSLRMVLCGKSQYSAFNSQVNQSSLSLRAPQRMPFLRDTQ